MKLKRKIRSLCLSILICCLLIGNGLDMTAICHAENGDVAIEPAGTDGCVDSHAGHSTDEGLSSRDDSGDCCIDVPISFGSAFVVKDPCRIDILLSASTTPTLATGCLADSSSHRLPPEFVSPPPYFAPLSSVILII